MVPYSTDAPIYHYPLGTVALIAANFLCFVAIGSPAADHGWVLHFGAVNNPLEWLTNLFRHANWGHLIGNLYFLWLFGLVVEGRLGWRRFVPLYLAIGIAESGVSQVAMLGADTSIAFGASGAIMGLMVICLVWAPKNEFSVFILVFYRLLFFDVTILVYCLVYLGWELISLALVGFWMSTPLLHLNGAVLGFAAGVLYLKKGWVDCENWDLFAVLKGTHGRFGDETTTVGSHADASLLFGKEISATEPAIPQTDDEPPPVSQQLQSVFTLIDSGHLIEAVDELLSLRMRDASVVLDEAQIYLEEYRERFPEAADWCRLRQATIELHDRRRPAAALQYVKRVRLSDEQKHLEKRTALTAKKQIRAGITCRRRSRHVIPATGRRVDHHRLQVFVINKHSERQSIFPFFAEMQPSPQSVH